MADNPIDPGTSSINTRPISELMAVNPEYDAKSMAKYRDFFEGGQRFHKNISKYLRMRNFESGPSGTNGFFKQRAMSAAYINIVGPLIGWLASCSLSSKPTISAKSKYSPNDLPLDTDTPEQAKVKANRRQKADASNAASIAYYTSLNTNADGKGNDLTTVSRERLIDAMVYGRSCFSIVFPDPKIDDLGQEIQYSNIKTQLADGALDARISGLSPIEVIDWQCAEDGTLAWAKIHCTEWGRDTTWGPITKQDNYWTFIDDNQSVCYKASRSIDDTASDTWPTDAVAYVYDAQEHSLSTNPVIELCVKPDFHIMSRLYDTAWDLFNRSANLSFSLDCQALALPVYKTTKAASDIGSFIASELALIVIKPDESLTFEAPTTSHFEASASNVKTLKDDMYAQVLAMSAQSSTIPSAGRLSGISKKLDVEMLSSFLSVFAGLIKNGLQKAVSTIQTARGDDNLEVNVEGLDSFVVSDVATMLDRVKSLCELPASVTAKRHSLSRAAQAVCSDASATVLDKIRSESDIIPEDALNNVKISVKESIKTTDDQFEEDNEVSPINNE